MLELKIDLKSGVTIIVKEIILTIDDNTSVTCFDGEDYSTFTFSGIIGLEEILLNLRGIYGQGIYENGDELE